MPVDSREYWGADLSMPEGSTSSFSLVNNEKVTNLSDQHHHLSPQPSRRRIAEAKSISQLTV